MNKLKIDIVAELPPHGERKEVQYRPATLSITNAKIHWMQPNGLHGKEPHVELHCWMCGEHRPLIDFLGYVGTHVHKKKTYGLLGKTLTCRHCSGDSPGAPGRRLVLHLDNKGAMLLHMTNVYDDNGVEVKAFVPDKYGNTEWRSLSEAIEFRMMKKPEDEHELTICPQPYKGRS